MELISAATYIKLTPRSESKAIHPKTVLCCNMFEHVDDRYKFASICDEVLSPGGYLLITVPHSYPYHLDPIDTMFRPSVDEIAKLFPYYELVEGMYDH